MGLARADLGDQSRFADARIAHQPDIREQLEFEANGNLVGRLAFLGKFRGLKGGGRESDALPRPPCPPLAAINLLAVVGKVREQPAGIRPVNERPDRHLEDQIFPILAVPVVSPAVAAALGLVMPLISQVDERVYLRFGRG